MYDSTAPVKTIPVMHCFDNNYAIQAAVSFFSMLDHASKKYQYKLYVLHTDITWQNQEKLIGLVTQFPNATLEFINMSHRFNDLWDEFRDCYYSKEVLYKLIAASIFPMHEKIIVTDVDVVFLGDISQSYFSFEESDQYILAGVKHIVPRDSFLEEYYKIYIGTFGEDALSQLKVCGGYLVLNLKRIREEKTENIFLEYLKTNASLLYQAEQDVLNFCLREDQVTYLPLNYVVCSYAYDIFISEDSLSTDKNYNAHELKNALEKPIQLHYASQIKPWNTPHSTMAEYWFSYLGKTNFRDDFVYLSLALQRDWPTQYMPFNIWLPYESSVPQVDISVLCCSYNHGKYIRMALEGIVNQKINASVEVIVSDDASSDDTQSIILEYKEKYPHLFKKCILRKQNVGIGRNYTEAFQLVEGKYLAICDGDDFWIDPNKLQKQYDFLDQHQDFSVCCSNFKIHTINTDIPEDTNSYINDWAKMPNDTVFYIDDWIQSSWQKKEYYQFMDLLYCRFVASCTAMLRWHLHERVPEFIKEYRYIDFILSLIHTGFGKIHVMNNETFAQHNIHAGSLTTQNIIDEIFETDSIIHEVDQYLNYHFTKEIAKYFKMKKDCKKDESALRMGLWNPATNVSLDKYIRFKLFYRDRVPPVLKKCFRGCRNIIKRIYHK